MIATQLDAFAAVLDDAPAPYQRHSATSREAAERIAPVAGTHARDVLNAIVAAGPRGATRKELSLIIGWAECQQNRITGRVDALIKAGLVRVLHAIEYDRLGEPSWQVVRRDGSAVLIATTRQG